MRPEHRGADRAERPEAIPRTDASPWARASRSPGSPPPGDRAPRGMRRHRPGARRRRPARELPPGRHPSPWRRRPAGLPTPPRWPRPPRPSRRVPGTTPLRTSRPALPRGHQRPAPAAATAARAIAGASAHDRAARRPPRAASHRKPSVSAIGTRCEAARPAGSGRPKPVVGGNMITTSARNAASDAMSPTLDAASGSIDRTARESARPST